MTYLFILIIALLSLWVYTLRNKNRLLKSELKNLSLKIENDSHREKAEYLEIYPSDSKSLQRAKKRLNRKQLRLQNKKEKNLEEKG